MISIEAARDGFVIFVNGERSLVHSRRSPCIEIGKAEQSLKRVRGSLCARRKRSSWLPLRDFSVVENSEERTTIDFAGQIRMSFCRENELLRLSFSRYDPSINLFRLNFQAYPDEFIYGAGERRSRLDLKGRRIPLWVEETGALREGISGKLAAEFGASARSAHGLSFPLPVFVSSRHYWCAARTTAFTVLDFTRRGTSTIEAWEVPKEIVMGRRGDAAAVAADIVSILGRQPPLPPWCHDGAWYGVELGGSAAGLKDRVESALAAGVKIGAVLGQGMLVKGKTASMRRPLWDSPEGDSFTEGLRVETERWRARGIRFIGYADPWLDPAGALFAEAKARDFLVKNQEGGACLLPWSGGHVAVVDLTGPKAAAWLSQIMVKDLARTGACGWMADSGGRLPADAVLASREDARLCHNRWTRLFAEVCASALAAAGHRADGLFAMRSGWIGLASILPSAWSGGRIESFDREEGLPSVIPAALSLGLCGIGSWHTEVGGSRLPHHGRRQRECLERWMEIAAFSPIFRFHENRRPEGGALAPSPLETASLDALARMTEIFAALKPYHAAVAEEYLHEGLPALRHPWVQYGDDIELHTRDYQYLYGRDLLVAPTVEAGKSVTEVYLPRDEWVHLWSSRLFKGGLVTVESPLGCPAVFYRALSSFAPLFDSIRRTSRRQ